MVSDSDLVARLRDILANSDLDTATPGSIRRQLEEHFGADLSDRKTFIREQIDAFLNAADEEGEQQENVIIKEEEGEQQENVIIKEEEGEQEEDEEEDGSEEEEIVVKKNRGGFNKLCSLSPQLQDLFGVAELARTQVVKRIWEYIREKNLQDPNKRRVILCDEALFSVFRVKSIDMFQMSKALSKHIWPLDEIVQQKVKPEPAEANSMEEDNDQEDEGEENEKRGKKRKVDVKKKSNGPRKKKKKRGRSAKVVEGEEVKKRGGGFNKLCSLSPQLQDVVGESELARPEVVKKLWAYIRENNLQDPTNKRTILCDERLRTLFEVDSIDMFQMSKALSKHIFRLDGTEAKDSSSQEEKEIKQEREDGSQEEKGIKQELEDGSQEERGIKQEQQDGSQEEKGIKQEQEDGPDEPESKGKRQKECEDT